MLARLGYYVPSLQKTRAIKAVTKDLPAPPASASSGPALLSAATASSGSSAVAATGSFSSLLGSTNSVASPGLVSQSSVGHVAVDVMPPPFEQRVDTAMNGNEAVNMVKNQLEDYDIIFMDIMMPEKDGITASREIRAWYGEEKQRNRTLPCIVALTANALEQDRQGCLEVMNDYMCKPITLADMENMVRKMGTPIVEKRQKRNA